jgi:small subunit ribosomal protein S7
MPRRAAPPKKRIPADPIYGSVLVQQLINKIMLDGKKSTAEKIVYDALSFIEERTGSSPVTVLNNALDNIRPRLEVRSRRVGGATYQVPVEVNPRRANTLALRWMVAYARATTLGLASNGGTTPIAWQRQTEHSHITGGDKGIWLFP